MNKHGRALLAISLLLAMAPTLAAESAPWTDPGSGAEFVEIPAGCFIMGADAPGGFAHEGHPRPPNADEMPRHEVCVDPFWISRHELTRGQWHKVMGEEAPWRGQDEQPASHLKYSDALRYLERLSATAADGSRFRLPTEAEWEYACRAGSAPVYATDHTPALAATLAASAWYSYTERPHDDPQLRPVGTRTPNAWGLYDMLGNVAEWVADAYRPDGYAHHASHNPRVDVPGSERFVLRGGSYKSDWWNVRCSVRNYGFVDEPLYTAGMRVVRVPAAASQ